MLLSSKQLTEPGMLGCINFTTQHPCLLGQQPLRSAAASSTAQMAKRKAATAAQPSSRPLTFPTISRKECRLEHLRGHEIMVVSGTAQHPQHLAE